MIDVVATAGEVLRRAQIEFDRLSVIELNRSGAGVTSVALLTFVDGGRLPAAFLKLTRDTTRARALDDEFGTLQRLQQAGSERIRASVPRPLFRGAIGGVEVLAETPTPGSRMKNFPPDPYFASRRFLSHFADAVEWLGEFHESFAAPDLQPRPDDESPRAAIKIYRSRFRLSSELDDLLAQSMEQLEAATLPVTPWHGDFCSANLIVAEDQRLYVIDWEYPLSAGWPLADLLYFFSSLWCVPYEKGALALQHNFRRMFFEEHRHSKRILEAMLGYLRRLGIDRRLALALSVISWVVYANRKGTSSDFPLIMIEQERCLNLEYLAQRPTEYLSTRP